MEYEVTILKISLRAIAEMVVGVLENEGIDAAIRGTSFLTSAYQMDAGIFVEKPMWRVVVSSEREEEARKILSEMEDWGEEMEGDDASPEDPFSW